MRKGQCKNYVQQKKKKTGTLIHDSYNTKTNKHDIVVPYKESSVHILQS